MYCKTYGPELNRVIAGEYDHTGKAIVYGDTDSTYFSAYPVLKDQIDKGEIAWDKDTIIEYYDAVGEEVNKTFRFYAQQFLTTHNPGKIIATGREVVGEAGTYYKEALCYLLFMILKANVRIKMASPVRLRLWVWTQT